MFTTQNTMSKAAYRRKVYLHLGFQSNKSDHWGINCYGSCTTKRKINILNHKQEAARKLGMILVFKNLKAVPSHLLPPGRPYLLSHSNGHHQLVTSFSKIRVYVAHSHSIHHRVSLTLLLRCPKPCC